MIMKLRILSVMVVAIAAIFGVSARDNVTRDVNVLPAPARTYITKNFKADISLIEVDKKLGQVREYEVILTDGTEVKFDRSGNWKEIEAPRGKAVPDAIVPDAIRSYVKKNHKGAKVVSVERKGSDYEVELSDGTDMRFNSAGTFLRYT